MLRRTAKISVRLGVLFVIALVIKKILDSQRQETGVSVPQRTPAEPPIAKPDPEPAAATVEEATAPEPEPAQPDPDPEPEPAQPEPEPAQPDVRESPAPVAETAPADADPAPEPSPAPAPVKKAAKKAAKKRTEPLKARKAAEKAARPTRANRKPPADGDISPTTPVGAILSWVEPVGNICPPTHPIKAKLGSRVFRRPGSPGYDNSKPDRCYASEGAARRGGFNEAQR